jgi:probable rRNA maturation factor
MSVDVCNESGRAVDEAALVGLARHVLRRLRIHPLAELSILLVDRAAMEQLHQQWMDEPGPTDVLAFPMDELRPGSGDDEDPEPGLLGDVVLCPEIAEQQAREAGHGVEDELHLLCAHGILHLLGYDHADPAEQQQMFGLQGQLLASWREERRPAGGRR